MKLSEKAFAIAAGLLGAVYALVFHFWILLTGAGADFMSTLITDFHPGASLTYGGAVIHALWMFVYGFVGGWSFAWIYNKFVQ